MTLVLNEIHLLNGLGRTFIVAAADRRISKPDGSYDSTRQKLFPISHLNGAMSYFGLAVVFPRGQRQYISTWLPSFIRRRSAVQTLADFAESLREELNSIVPSTILRDNPSGFHICGYDKRGYPDFWYISNIGGIRDFQYIDIKEEYAPAASHFLDRDAIEKGWKGEDPLSVENGVHVYRNGDFRAHVAAWELLDIIFGQLIRFPDFKRPDNIREYGKYVKFKFEFIAYLYKKWAKKEIIARPIDVHVLEPGAAYRADVQRSRL